MFNKYKYDNQRNKENVKNIYYTSTTTKLENFINTFKKRLFGSAYQYS